MTITMTSTQRLHIKFHSHPSPGWIAAKLVECLPIIDLFAKQFKITVPALIGDIEQAAAMHKATSAANKVSIGGGAFLVKQSTLQRPYSVLKLLMMYQAGIGMHVMPVLRAYTQQNPTKPLMLTIVEYRKWYYKNHTGAKEIWTPISLAIGSLVTRVVEVSQAELEPSYPNGTDDFYHQDADMQKGSSASVYFKVLLFRVNSKTDFPRHVWLIAEQDDMILEIKRLGRMPQNQEQVALRKVVKHSWSAIMNRVITLGGLKNILCRPLSYFHVDESEVLDEEQDLDDFVGYTIPDDDNPSDDGEAEKDDQNTTSGAQIESADDNKFTVDTVTDTSIIDLTDDDDDQIPNKSTWKRRRAKALTVTSDDEEEVIVISDDENDKLLKRINKGVQKRRKTD
ncbi:hypothetical protein C8J56DRAFT_1081469 [Mycena floridula]|nr:hypothetical protein C8J56DRAFT_1081469 [Mycena floridula]